MVLFFRDGWLWATERTGSSTSTRASLKGNALPLKWMEILDNMQETEGRGRGGGRALRLGVRRSGLGMPQDGWGVSEDLKLETAVP